MLTIEFEVKRVFFCCLFFVCLPIGGFHMTSPERRLCKSGKFLANFCEACRMTWHVSLPKLQSFGPLKIELWAKEVGEFSITLYGRMSWWTFFCPLTWLAQYRCMEISKLWTTAITLPFIGVSAWNLQRTFRIGLSTLCTNFVKKVVNLNFWWLLASLLKEKTMAC